MEPKLFYIGIKGILVKDGRVLLLQRKDQQEKLFWDIPGGRMGEGEDVRDTLVRELREELPGVEEIVIGELLHAAMLPRNLNDGNGLMLLYFKVTAKLEEVTLSEEHITAEWVGIEELEELKTDGVYITEGNKEAVKRALVVAEE